MSTFGRLYKVTTFGESHCKAVGVIVDGCPPNLELNEKDIQKQLTRRRPGQSKISTPRNETDEVFILSGIERGITLGTPIGAMVKNRDMRPEDYKFDRKNYLVRPSHADLTYHLKYGIHASSGGGRSSARETISRVIAGTIAGTAQTIIDTPIEVMKIRLITNKGVNSNINLKNMFTGFTPTLFRNVKFAAIFNCCSNYSTNNTNIERFTNGAVAGFTASVISHPWDVVKTELQRTNSKTKSSISFIYNTMLTNPLIFTSGMLPRAILSCCTMSVSFVTFLYINEILF